MEQYLRSSWAGYTLAVLSVTLTLLVLWLIPPLQSNPFFLFTTAVMISAWFGGLNPGLLATCLSVAVVNYFFLAPTWSFNLGIAELAQLLTFTLLAILISSLNAQRRHALGDLQQVQETLQQQVQERTAALTQVNATLQAEIAERKKLEDEYRNVVECQTEMICRFHSDTTLTFVNEAYCRFFGKAREELLGTPFLSLFHESVREQLRQIIVSLAQEPRVLNSEYELVRLDGSPIWNHWITSPIFDATGTLTEFQAVGRDITRRKQAERALHESEARYRRIIETADEGIWLIGANGQTEFINPRGAEMLGYLADEMPNRSPLEVMFPEDIAENTARLEAHRQGRREQFEYRLRHREGHEVWVRSKITPVSDEQGQYLGVLAMFTDMTEQRHIEAQLRRTQRLESLGTLAGGIAHDLNNILAPILVSINMLQREWRDEKSRRRLELMRRNVVRGSEIVKQVLTFARGSQGAPMRLHPAPLLKEIVKLMQETLPQTITIEALIPDNLWPLKGDATQLHQVLMNLCVNARDAMPHGGRLRITAENVPLDKVCAKMHAQAHCGRYLRLTVNDTGTGIPAPLLDKIFDPFFTTKEVGKGTGLGLATVQGIMKGHGGFVEVESRLDHGTQFSLYFPVDETAPKSQTITPLESSPQGNSEMILIAEDEAPLRNTLQEMLEGSGYRVLTACDGTEAVTLYTRHQSEIHAVLMDLHMPYLDGLSAFRVLRKMKADVKVIVTSGLASDSKIKDILDEHAVAFLSKPYTAEQLLGLLAATLKEVTQPV